MAPRLRAQLRRWAHPSPAGAGGHRDHLQPAGGPPSGLTPTIRRGRVLRALFFSPAPACDNCRTVGETTGGVLRRGSDRIVGGVCAGLAVYFGVDPLLVRVVFVILALVPPGIGILLYLVLWFLMEPPLGQTTSATRSVGE